MESKNIKITPEVSTDQKILYLIRMNKEEIVFVDTEREAKLVIDSIAATETERLSNEWTKVYRQDIDECKKVIISTQSIGFILNGPVGIVSMIDYIPIGHAILTKSRMPVSASLFDLPPPQKTGKKIPNPSVLEFLAKEAVKPKESDDSEDD